MNATSTIFRLLQSRISLSSVNSLTFCLFSHAPARCSSVIYAGLCPNYETKTLIKVPCFTCIRNYGMQPDSEISIVYQNGLPVISVPLPSRKETCTFVLKPVASTVGDFLSSLKEEDRGVDRAVIYSADGYRMAASTLIEHLLKDVFILSVNDTSFQVNPPPMEQASSDVTASLDQAKILIAQLYSQLNIEEHQKQKEQVLLKRLEDLKANLQPFEESKQALAKKASKRTDLLMWGGLAAMATQFGILARLTWWEYSWDIMEPVTYFITYGTAIIMYGYFLLTQQEYVYPDARDRQYLRFFYRQADKAKFDVDKYNQLCAMVAEIEADLRRLRDPLQLNLPIEPIRKQDGQP